jgi:hypothetical protein
MADRAPMTRAQAPFSWRTPGERTEEQRLADIEELLEDANILSSFGELTFGMVQVKMALERIEKRLGIQP